jgi:hypothetical protein
VIVRELGSPNGSRLRIQLQPQSKVYAELIYPGVELRFGKAAPYHFLEKQEQVELCLEGEKRHDAALALMHWCLLDPSGMSYHPGTPLKAPLGGSQSALSYLALALQARGHRVSFVLKGQPPPDSPRAYLCLRDIAFRLLATGL